MSSSKYLNKTLLDFSLPDLPEPSLPAVTSAGDKPTHDIYAGLREVRRQLDLPEREAHIRAALLEDPAVAKAMYAVLLESRKIIDKDGRTIEPPPLQPAPTLPVGCKSWLQQKF